MLTLPRRWSGRRLIGPLAAFTVLACSASERTTSVTPPVTTPVTEPPTVLFTTPTGGATGVDVQAPLRATFSQEMDATSITSTAFRINGVDGSVSYAGSVATLQPTRELAYATTYTASIAATAKSTAGKALAQEYTWTFKTADAPLALTAMPLSSGKRWRYERADTVTISAASTGYSKSSLDKETFVIADAAVTWQSRSAWRVLLYDYATPATAKPGFSVRTEYLAQSSTALERWRAGSNQWRKILSLGSASFRSGTFFLLDGPTHGDEMQPSSSTAVVPAGSFATTKVTHNYTETGQYAPRDIFEKRSEQYATGIGLVRGDWSYSLDDNDPMAADVTSHGRVILTHVDAGPFPVVRREQESNDTLTTAAALDAFTIVEGDAAISDPGSAVLSANVGCTQCVNPNKNGINAIQDWFRLTIAATRSIRIELDFELMDASSRKLNDLDLYLFQQTATGIRFVASSNDEPGKRELIAKTLQAGTYFVALQAWDTPGARVHYWLSVR